MSEAASEIRRLTAADAGVYRPVRLDALRLHPTAFTAAYEDEMTLPPEEWARRLDPPGVVFGAFTDGKLVGITGLRREGRAKWRHKAVLVSVYVDAGNRRGGLARALAEAAIEHARAAGLLLLTLNVTVGNAGARRLYESLGFRSYGIERRSLRVGDAFYDDEMMALDLD